MVVAVIIIYLVVFILEIIRLNKKLKIHEKIVYCIIFFSAFAISIMVSLDVSISPYSNFIIEMAKGLTPLK